MNEAQKQELYKKWLANNRPWFSLDSSKEPTYAEKQIIMEMLKREAGIKSKSISKEEQERWLNRKKSELELEEAKRKSTPKNEIKAFDRLINNNY